MKRFMALIAAFFLCLQLVSCGMKLDGIGENKEPKVTENIDVPDITENLLNTETLPGDTDVMWSVCVDWMDFVRVNGIVYDGGFDSIEIDESRVGERIGEILYKVKSFYDNEEEFNQADKRDFSAAFRPIGCELFTVKDDENSIAVLDNGKYYLYSHEESDVIPFEVFGGESYSMPGSNDETRGVTINSFDHLCEAYGGQENIPEEILLRYSGDTLPNITLVIVELVSGWGGTEYGIEAVRKNGDNIHVSALQFDVDVDGDSAMHYWTFFIEIPKTDDKEVTVSVTQVKPLENDSELIKIPYETINNYICYDPKVDYSCYSGKPVVHRYTAEELVRSLGDYFGYSAFVRYCPSYNYWLVSMSRSNSSGTHIVDTVIRAADGKVISQIETYGCP